MPSEDDNGCFTMIFRNSCNRKVTYMVYADFECLQVSMEGCQKNPSRSYVEKTMRHVLRGVAYKVVGLTPDHDKEPVVYRGSDAVDKLISAMLEEQELIEDIHKHCKPLKMTGRDWQTLKKTAHFTFFATKSWERNVSMTIVM